MCIRDSLRKEIVLQKLPIETIVLPVSNWKMFFVQVMVTFGMFVFFDYCMESELDSFAIIFIWIYFAMFVWGVLYFFNRPSILIKNSQGLFLTSPIRALNKYKWEEIDDMKIVKPEWYMRFGRMASTDKLIVITSKGKTKLYDSSYSSNAWNEIYQLDVYKRQSEPCMRYCCVVELRV